ncbi:MAG: putative addiction module antidote protein [Alcanivorax sp.]|jgi:probable addiction module antidote protein
MNAVITTQVFREWRAMKSSTSQELGLRPFDITEFLDNDVAITEYLTQVLAEGDHEELLAAIGHVARARGMSDLARQTGLGRESLYKALRPGADPRFSTLMKVLHALGVHLQAVPDKIA